MMSKETTFSQEVQNLASGQAALLLLEALILQLVEKNVITADEAIDIVQTIVETKQQLILDRVEDEVGRCAVGKLLIIENSLRAVSRETNHRT